MALSPIPFVRFSRLLIGALLAGVLLAACSQPIFDAPLAKQVAPSIEEESVVFSEDFECSSLGYEFDVVADLEFDLRFTLFFDRNGDPKTLHVQVNGTEVYTNSVTGKTASSTNAGVDIVDLETGTVAQLGVLRALTLPGEGLVVIDAGRIVYDGVGEVTFVAGPHDLAGTDDITPICDAMS